MDHLAERQERILRCIRGEIVATGEGPSIRRIGQFVGLSSSSSVTYHFGRLQGRGVATSSMATVTVRRMVPQGQSRHGLIESIGWPWPRVASRREARAAGGRWLAAALERLAPANGDDAVGFRERDDDAFVRVG
ncbi:hypothetical protein OHS70_35260 [Streptomyces sp. NBC_00390]|uniref:LexA family protein n=1 Tax=Streptomyces sp. NBC_00390 TaxID=2975736 RepID=UPI002E1C5C3C